MTDAMINLVDVSLTYGDKKVLNSINLEIYPGEIIGYIGPNGAGKTSTVKIMTGMQSEFTGSAKLCGFSVKTDPLKVKQRIGYVPELAVLYEELTPLEYLLLVGRIHMLDDYLVLQRAKSLLTLLELGTEMNTQIQQFSKGMKQKVLLLAGIIHDPEIIILDEPLSGLDASSSMLVKEILILLAKQGKTVFYCSHIMDVVEKVCDRIVILDQGEIVSDSSFAQLQSMEQSDSLESIFAKITGLTDPAEIAKDVVSVFQTEQQA